MWKILNRFFRSSGHRNVDTIFMVEPGYLEWQGILLAASLMEFHTNQGKITAYCREARIGDLSKRTTDFFTRHKIEIRPITNPFSPEYPQGNKILAAQAHKNQDGGIVFLDTDTMLVSKTNFGEIVEPSQVSVFPVRKIWPEDGNTETDWLRAYAANDLDFDFDREAISDRAPYFNAGVVAFWGEDGFADAWLDVALRTNQTDLPNLRPWLDQVAIPIAIKKAGLTYSLLDRKWNCALNNTRPVEEGTHLVHYHRRRRITQKGYLKLANRLVRKYALVKSLNALITEINPGNSHSKT